jgi:hypothetical protein
MRHQFPIFWILTICLVSILGLGLWILWRDVPAGDPAQPPTPRDTSPPPRPTPPIRLAPSRVITGHRLAGTVVGDAQYAIVEDPRGASDLYHLGDMVSDLGELTQIEPDRVLFAGANGPLELRLASAPTETAAPATPTAPIGITTETEEEQLFDPPL